MPVRTGVKGTFKFLEKGWRFCNLGNLRQRVAPQFVRLSERVLGVLR